MKPAIFAAMVMVIALFAGIAWAQEHSTTDFLAVDSAFTNGQFETVELLVLRALKTGQLTPDETARLCLTAGYSLIMLNRESDARKYFSQALDAVPDLALDPVQVSPKFRVVFDDVAAMHRAQHPPVSPNGQSPEKNPATSADPSKDFAVARHHIVSNLIVPGAGQIRAGYPWRGGIFLAAQAATIGVMIWRIDNMSDSRANYLSATDPATMKSTYDRYNRDYQWAWVSGIAAGVVYLAAQVDLIRLEPRANTGKVHASLTTKTSPNNQPQIALVMDW